MKASELQEHRARFLQAYLNGQEIGLADEYVAKLEKVVTVSKGPRGSAEHLFALADKALAKVLGSYVAPSIDEEVAKVQELIVEEEVETEEPPPPVEEAVVTPPVVEEETPAPSDEKPAEKAPATPKKGRGK